MTATFVISVFILGFAFGPLVIAPLSEIYGRNPIYHCCNVLFVLFSVGCALSTNMGMLIAFRFLSGFAGCAVVTCGAGSIADMMPTEYRGRAMSIWAMGPLLGPSVGPVIAGFVVEYMGWRWAFWIVVIAVSDARLRPWFRPEVVFCDLADTGCRPEPPQSLHSSSSARPTPRPCSDRRPPSCARRRATSGGITRPSAQWARRGRPSRSSSSR